MARNTETDEDIIPADKNPYLEGGEARLVRALLDDKLCFFDHENEPEENRTIRGSVLGAILRQDCIEGANTSLALPRKIQVVGAAIKGDLDASDTDVKPFIRFLFCNFNAPIDFDRASFKILIMEHCKVLKLSLNDAKVSTDCNFNYTKITGSISFVSAKITGDVYLRNAEVQGETNFGNAIIGGQLSATDAKFILPSGKALWAQGAKIEGDVFLRGAEAQGETNFGNAIIGGQLSATDAKFILPSGKALWAQGAKIEGGVFLRGVEAQGETNFSAAEIGKIFSANQAKFILPSGKALWAQGAKIKGGVFLRGAEVHGRANFTSAHIDGTLSLKDARLQNIGYKAFSAQSLQVKGLFWLTSLKHPPLGNVVLTNAKFSDIVIDEKSFPFGRFKLDGCTFDKVTKSNGKAHKNSLGWLEPPQHDTDGQVPGFSEAYQAIYTGLERESPDATHQEIAEKTWSLLQKQIAVQLQQERSPFAYRQFSKTLDANGHEAEARDIRVLAGRAYTERNSPKNSKLRRWPYLVWRWFLGTATGYSAKPWKIFKWLGGTWLAGAAVFALCSAEMTPAKERYYMATIPAGETLPPLYIEGDPLPEGYPKFSPIIYALDVMLPFIDIAQETHWRPRAKEDWRERWLLYFNRLYLLLGWFLTTVGLAGLTGLFADKKEP